MAGRRTGDNPLSEPMMTQFNDAYTYAPLGLNELKRYAYKLAGLMQKRRNSSVLALELRLSCTNPSTELYMLLLNPPGTETGILGWNYVTSNGSCCMGIKGEMSGTVCVTFTWDMYIYIYELFIAFVFCCLFITVTWWYVWCIEWASGDQEEVPGMFGNLMAIYHIMLQFIQNHYKSTFS